MALSEYPSARYNLRESRFSFSQPYSNCLLKSYSSRHSVKHPSGRWKPPESFRPDRQRPSVPCSNLPQPIPACLSVSAGDQAVFPSATAAKSGYSLGRKHPGISLSAGIFPSIPDFRTEQTFFAGSSARPPVPGIRAALPPLKIQRGISITARLRPLGRYPRHSAVKFRIPPAQPG